MQPYQAQNVLTQLYQNTLPSPQDIKGFVNQLLLLHERTAMLSLCISTVLGLLMVVGLAASQENATLPVRYNATILQGDGGGCPTDEEREAVKANVSQDLRALFRGLHAPLPDPESYSCGGFGTRWTRIAYLNMSDLTQECPQNWSLITSPKRTCGRSTGVRCISSTVPCTCDSAIFSNYRSSQYSRVCGRVTGYRVGSSEGFKPYFQLMSGDIDRPYAEGVSITHGSPRQHIWTLATAKTESRCPCGSSSLSSPSFVGNDYFCEVGDPPSTSSSVGNFYANDPLWDGDGCKSGRTCCTFNTPPWFQKELPSPTTDNIEVRLCADDTITDENFPIELIEK